MSNYNPVIHHRRSIRLKNFDYSKSGFYFITLVCQNRIHRFGEIEDSKIILNEFGQIAEREWLNLPTRFLNIELHTFQIMPDHIHFILQIREADTLRATARVAQTAAEEERAAGVEREAGEERAAARAAQTDQVRATLAVATDPPTAPSLGDIVGAYKSIVSVECLKIYKSKNETMGKLWLRNYYERIIRNETAYHAISKYISENPSK